MNTSHRNVHLAVLIALVMSLTALPVAALTLEGQIVDRSTGNPIPDAIVQVERYVNTEPVSTETLPDKDFYDMTDMAGKFRIKVGDLRGVYTLNISHISYKEAQINATVPGKAVVIELEPASLQLAEVVVSAGRGVPGQTPGALSNIDRDLVEMSYSAQDVPLVIDEIPSATAFSWSGSDVGAAEIRIRGFGQDRIAATVNGVPINDPEDHNIYWQDTPDFLTNTFDIQVERGVSSFMSGPAGVGGGLNLVTSDAVSKRELAITYQSGNFNTERRTLAYRSGMIDGRYNFTGRFSRVTTDGYRDHTGADNWSYFLAAARFDANMVTRLQVYGGQEEMDAYWWGLDKSTLEKNREANYSAKYKDYMSEFFWEETVNYHGERDFFEQPHYMLHNQWRLSPKLELNQSLFWIQGNGFYEEWKFDRKFAEYNLKPFDVIRDEDEDGVLDTVTIDRTDLIRRKHVEKDHTGWLPRLNWKVSKQTQLDFGLELRAYESDHWGQVMWARELPEGVDPQHMWYRWKGSKDYYGGYVNIQHSLSDRLKLNGGIQIRQVSFNVDQEVMGAFDGQDYELDWMFINPRLGLTYQLDPSTSLYASFAGAGREPIDNQIYDADNPDDIPKVKKYGQEEIDAERMWDIEIGARKEMGNASLGVNFYGMFFTDEIIAVGFSSELDEEVYDNAPTSRHIGIELDGKWRDIAPDLTLSGNVSYGQATLGDYEFAYRYNWGADVDTINLDANQMALFPNIVANLRATYKIDPATISFHLHHVGEQYMDNREDDNAKLDSYTVLDGALILRLKNWFSMELDIELRGMNLFDVEYEPHGVVDVEYGVPYYVPAAGRRYLAGVTLKL